MRSLAGEDLWFFNGPVRPVLTASFWAGGNFWFFNGPLRPVLKLRSHAVEDLWFFISSNSEIQSYGGSLFFISSYSEV